MAYYPQRKQKNFFSCYDYDDGEPEHKMKTLKPSKVQYIDPIYQPAPQATYIQPQQTITQPVVQQQPLISSSIKYTQPTYVNQPQQQISIQPPVTQQQIKPQIIQTQAYQQQPLQTTYVNQAPIQQQIQQSQPPVQFAKQPSVKYTQPTVQYVQPEQPKITQVQYTQPPVQYSQPPVQYSQPPVVMSSPKYQQVSYLPQQKQKNFFSCYDYEATPHNLVQVKHRRSSSIKHYQRPAQMLPQPQYIQQPQYGQQSVQPTYVSQTPKAQQQIQFAQSQVQQHY